MLKNYFVGIMQEAFESVFGMANARRVQNIQRARQYRQGYQPKRLQVRPPLSDDNIIVNFAGLVVERAVSLLFGEGVEFDLPGEGETPADVWLTKVWEVNKLDELLNDIGDYGASSGTPTVLFDADTVYSEGVFYPEVSCLDPQFLEVKTDPANYKRILYYKIEYDVELEPNKIVHRRRMIMPQYATEGTGEIILYWVVRNEELQGNQWVLLDAFDWEYEWPPILPWKNLPNPGSPYGKPDLTDDVLDVQDAINLVASNINKVMRLQAHQRLWGRHFGNKAAARIKVDGQDETKREGGLDVIEMGPDKILNSNNDNAHLEAIEANSSFQDMTLFLHELRDSMFAIARSTDPHSLKDKVGQITNFGLRILYKDALDKLNTKRKLYGEALKEINRRLLILGGFPPDPGQVKWKDALPENESETIAAQKFELEQGITSKQTIREERGRDNDTEKERLEGEAQDAEANADNIGGQLLNNFTRGKVQR